MGGYVHAMTGGTLRHDRIALNIAARLRDAARGGPCHVFINDVRVRVDETTFYHPDVVVVREPVDLRPVVVRDPCLVVERHSRDHDGRWRPGTLAGPDRDRLIVRWPDVEPSLDEV